ncbi:hypothetical protein C7212DRAFT_365754 [Tuber magnatum]|uniref:Uncharacterized protein n=1 Tax=Tuber magnatum TaxID=42249 RepID=A0A317SGJ6_9PEZI|nr:hypothetical protein C7212DRAFT_365754 [Tuber magnatum]
MLGVNPRKHLRKKAMYRAGMISPVYLFPLPGKGFILRHGDAGDRRPLWESVRTPASGTVNLYPERSLMARMKFGRGSVIPYQPQKYFFTIELAQADRIGVIQGRPVWEEAASVGATAAIAASVVLIYAISGIDTPVSSVSLWMAKAFTGIMCSPRAGLGTTARVLIDFVVDLKEDGLPYTPGGSGIRKGSSGWYSGGLPEVEVDMNFNSMIPSEQIEEGSPPVSDLSQSLYLEDLQLPIISQSWPST